MHPGALFTVLLTALCLALPAHGDSRYDTWPGAAGAGDLESLVAELRRLTREAEQARAADPRFLRDLEDLADRYDRPWRQELLHDDFGDGDYRRDPDWTVLRGVFRADPRRGLVLDPRAVAAPAPTPSPGEERERDPGAELAMALLGSLMNQRQQGSGEPAPAAPGPPADGVIYTRLEVPNAFALEVELAVTEAAGAVEFGVFQGRADGPGYRLAVAPGPQGVVELLRVSGRGTAVVERARAEVGGTLRLGWTREKDGEMRVTLDGREVFASTDRGFRDPFIGLQVRHQGGGYQVREITLLGPGR
jgi:hypothetical protein